MTNAKDKFVLWGILLALVLGVFIGWYFPEGAQSLSFLGSLFFNALYLIIVPLIIASMIVGITALGDIRKLGRTARLAILYFAATSAIAVVIGIILAVVFQPGITGQSLATASSGANVGWSGMLSKIGSALAHTLNEMIPRNIIAAAAETKVLALIVFSLFFGGILSGMGPRAKPVITFFEIVNDAIMKLVHLVMYLAPLGVLGIVASKVGDKAGDLAGAAVGIGKFSLVVIIGLLIHAGLLTVALRFLADRDPWKYLANMGQALSTAVGVSSSSATLPVTMECVVEKNKVDQRAASFVLPLGTTINMDGTAMYQAVSAIFVCQLFGIQLGFEHYVILFITAILASVGAPGLPQAGIVMMTMVMSSIGVPAEIIGQGVGIILVVDWALDRGRTALNIYGDSIGAAVIANTFEFKTAVVRRRTPSSRTPSKRDSDRNRSMPRRSSAGAEREPRRASSADRQTRRKAHTSDSLTRPSPERFGGASSGAPRKSARTSQRAPLTEAEINSEREVFAGMIEAPVFDLSAFETSVSYQSPAAERIEGPAATSETAEDYDESVVESAPETTFDDAGNEDEQDGPEVNSDDDVVIDSEVDEEEGDRSAPEEAVVEETETVESDDGSDTEDSSASPDSSPDSTADREIRFGRTPRRGV